MDPITDILIRIKNAYAAGHERVLIPASNAKFQVAKVLENSGFILELDRKKKKIKNTIQSFIEAKLKYTDGAPAIKGMRILSRPSRRLYVKRNDIRPVLSGYGISVISTPKGIMTGDEARKSGVGGQLIAEVW